MMMSQAGMLSEDGICRSFSASANGIGVGEAVVALVLKTMGKLEADGDNIYAVIKASGINFDGKTTGVTAPNGAMQVGIDRNHIPRKSHQRQRYCLHRDPAHGHTIGRPGRN